MALTGLDIYKLLPKTNCRDCESPTCLAFAMKLAQKKADLSACPHVSEDAKLALAAAAEPPIRTVKLGNPAQPHVLGGETVMYRHEKTFYHPCGLGVSVEDNVNREELDKFCTGFNALEFDRVGEKVRTEYVCLRNLTGKKEQYISVLHGLKDGITNPQVVYVCLNPVVDALPEIIKILAPSRVAVGLVNKDNLQAYIDISKKMGIALILDGETLDDALALSASCAAAGVKDILINVRTENYAQCFESLVQLRRLALKKNYRPAGIPAVVFIDNKDDPYTSLALASMVVAKYGALVFLPSIEPWQQLALVTLRQNIYTDPQKPVTVEPKLYTVGGTPDAASPVMVTTNFSLTYFTVEPEIVNSKTAAWLLVVDTEGMSVLTAWSAEKFTAERVVNAMKAAGIEQKVAHRKLILPGYVAVMSGKLADLSGWEVLVGPREASGIPKFIKSVWKNGAV
ncbi:MAG: acetyl-CoA decarbonylase/synthase complex subunit gamma [Elusimicrobiota bacterium]